MAQQKQEVISFKVDARTMKLLQNIPNRSEFIRTAVLRALENTCPLCGGTGVLTLMQKKHWDEFREKHSLIECADCHEMRLICVKSGEGAASQLHHDED